MEAYNNLRDRLTEEIAPEELAGVLDDVIRDYSSYLLNDESRAAQQGAEGIHFLWLIRDSIKRKEA